MDAGACLPDICSHFFLIYEFIILEVALPAFPGGGGRTPRAIIIIIKYDTKRTFPNIL
jgi:hypothetical protein